jgi:hypothetical protein
MAEAGQNAVRIKILVRSARSVFLFAGLLAVIQKVLRGGLLIKVLVRSAHSDFLFAGLAKQALHSDK